MRDMIEEFDVNVFIKKIAELGMDGEKDNHFYSFIGEKLKDVSDICLLISKEELSQAHIFAVKHMLDAITSCVDMRMQELNESEE